MNQQECGFTTHELAMLKDFFKQLGIHGDDDTVFMAALHMGHGGLTWAQTQQLAGVDRHKILAFLTACNHVTFDESIRWRAGERDGGIPFVTYLIDFTTTELENCQDPAYYSGHKKMYCLKYLVCVTAQGTPVSCIGPFPGRRHDYHYFREPLTTHHINDCALADGGFQGAGPHLLLPVRMDHELTAEEHATNRLHRLVRSRVERYFAFLKRHRIVRSTTLVRDEIHAWFVHFLVLCDHVVLGLTPKQYAPATIPLEPMDECFCHR